MKRLTNVARIGIVALLFGTGCSQSSNSTLSPGMAKKHIEIGKTTQAEVVETFGTPNIITKKSDYEMWVWDKVSSKTTSAAFGAGGIGGGGGHSGIGGGGLAGGVSSTERSETTMMLIVYFDSNDVVRDYKLSQTKF